MDVVFGEEEKVKERELVGVEIEEKETKEKEEDGTKKREKRKTLIKEG